MDAALLFGACVEVVHNGTLVHDDIQDRDELRRGVATLWKRFGIAQALNVGDTLLVAPLFVLLTHPTIDDTLRPTLSESLAHALLETIRGQVADVELRNQPAPSLESAAAVARAKTAPLFCCALEGTVLLLGGGESERTAARELGEQIGLAFQIRDDLLDFIGTKGRGQRGADIREGKPSWPVLEALEAGPPVERKRLLAALNRAAGGDKLSDEVVEHWLLWVAAHGGGDKAGQALANALSAARGLAPTAFPCGGQQTIAALCDRLESLDG